MLAARGLPQSLSLAPHHDVRKAKAEDCPLLPVVERAAAELFRGTGLIDVDTAGVQSLKALNAGVAEGLLWVATAHGAPVGFALGEGRQDQLYLAEVSVHPEHGRKGLGRSLVSAVCREAVERRLLPVVLSTFRALPWNAPFYARLGFTDLAEADRRPWHRALRAKEARSMDIRHRCLMAWTG
ncbi:MAG: GNAT family N-acetyltransferase [Alphaproteobacteria bacterium]